MSDGLLTSFEGTLLLLVIALVAHEPFRWLGLYLGHGLDAQSEIFAWVRAVSTALVAFSEKSVATRIVLISMLALLSFHQCDSKKCNPCATSSGLRCSSEE